MPILVIFFSLFCSFCSAQTCNPASDINRTNIWHFGTPSVPWGFDAPSLDFSNGIPAVVNIGGNVKDGAASICDWSGQLQLYGGFLKIFDKTYNPMENSGVVGDSGWIGISQANLAIPKPDNPEIIYYFSTSVTLKYSIVDMSLNNGKGAVIQRNTELMPIPTGVKLTAIHHCNGKDVWIVLHKWSSDEFVSFLLTETGIDASPVVTHIGPIDGESGMYQTGSIKFSPNGNKLVMASGGTVIPPFLFDFDKSTGTFSNSIQLHLDIGAEGTSFSPDNSKLYISTHSGFLVQYDLVSGDSMQIVQSRKVLAHVVPASFTAMQIGRDGRIYLAKAGYPGSDSLGVINNPNALDTLCDFNSGGIWLNGAFTYPRSLMGTVESYFYTGSSAYPCYGDTLVNSITMSPNTVVSSVVSPNPFSESASVDVRFSSKIVGKIDYLVYDMIGNKYECKIESFNVDSYGVKFVIYRGELNPGTYILHVNNRSTKLCSLKLSII